MRVTNKDLNFKSKIKLVTPTAFNNEINVVKNSVQEVTYPWTIETLKTGTNLYTTGIMDCIALFLTNGKESLLAHLGIRNKEQAQRDGVKEFDINNIENKLFKEINLADNNLHGFIFGGFQFKDNLNSGNIKQINSIKNLLDKYKLPFSTIAARKDIHFFGRYSLLYNLNKDTFFITNTLFDSNGTSGKRTYKEMVLENNDVSYNIYKQTKNKDGSINYKQKRVRTSTEDYFKSQFRLVNLNNFDQFI